MCADLKLKFSEDAWSISIHFILFKTNISRSTNFGERNLGKG